MSLMARWHFYRRRRAAAALLLLKREEDLQRTERRRSCWVKSWIARRREQGMHHNLFLELRLEDPLKFRRCLRMSTDMFEVLLAKVTPLIKKQDTRLRQSIPCGERLSLTLRHLATGETQESLQMAFRVGQSTISGIIRETVQAIYTVLKDEYLRSPASEEEWCEVSKDIYARWNFPNCLGAMDGKHFVIEQPVKSGSMYYNYKETYSVVLLAVVDAQLRFTLVDVGTNGRASDRGIWNQSPIRKCVENLKISPSQLPNSTVMCPYLLVGDEGFTLSEHLMIPYPKSSLGNRLDRRIFNYRLSRFRRCSENAFGVLVARFQIFRSALRYDPGAAKQIILATLALHNWLRSDRVGQEMYTPRNSVDEENTSCGTIEHGDWRRMDFGEGVQRLNNQGGNRHPVGALQLRDALCSYFNGVGAVPWQDKMVAVQHK